MDYVRQTVNSSSLYNLFDFPVQLRDKKVDGVILPVADETEKKIRNIKKQKINLGFVKGPSLPDSFFDPLPEEELQAWGL